MKRWLRVWILAAVPVVARGQASTGLPAPSTNGIGGVPVPTLATGYLYYNSGTNSFVFQSPSGSGSVNNCASAYAVAYYAGSGTAVSCSTAFTGLGYFSTGAAPIAATGAQIVSVIGSAAVANATSTTSFTGSLSGDVTGTESATTVGKINGGAVPASASVLSSNSSSQLTAATNIATTASSTLGGNANLFNNAAAATNAVEIQAGTSAAQTEELQWQNYSGTAEWDNSVDSSYTYHIQDAAHSSLDRITIYQGGGNTNMNAGNGAYEVCLNCAANSGTAGLVVQNGASSPSTVLTVTGSGNTTATGFVSGKFFMGNSTMTLATGAAAGSSPSIACATSHVCDGVSGTATLTTGTSPTTGTLATISFPNTHSNYANCIVTTESTTAVITTNTWTESTTAITITANTALTASTAYTVRYWCGGN
jgi:trimeric autotransporter adhesin